MCPCSKELGEEIRQIGEFVLNPCSRSSLLLDLSSVRLSPRETLAYTMLQQMKILLLLGLSGFFPLHPMMITSAERLRRKRAREILLASQKTDTEAAETEES